MRPLLGVLNVLHTHAKNVILDSGLEHRCEERHCGFSACISLSKAASKSRLSCRPFLPAANSADRPGTMTKWSLAIAAAQQVTAHAKQSTLNPKPLTLGLNPSPRWRECKGQYALWPAQTCLALLSQSCGGQSPGSQRCCEAHGSGAVAGSRRRRSPAYAPTSCQSRHLMPTTCPAVLGTAAPI